MAKLIGTDPNQVPTNGDLGDLAYQNYDVVAPQLLAGRRNLIINGAMQVAQRGTSFTPTASNQDYTLDRMGCYGAVGEMDYSQSTEAPSGFYNSLSISPNTANASPAAADFRVTFRYLIEGSDTVSTSWGTSSGKPCTLSFWMKTNKVGIYPYFITNNTQTTTFQTFINVTNTDWNYYTQTIPAPQSGHDFDIGSTDRSIDFQFNFGGLGSNYRTISSSDSTMNTWTGTSPKWSLSDAVNFDDSTSNQLYITGLQFEVGSVATPFEHRSYGEELALCQRYYQRYVSMAEYSIGTTGTVAGPATTFAVPMRASPSFDQSIQNAGSGFTLVAINTYGSSETGFYAFTMALSVSTSGYAYRYIQGYADAEL